MKIPIDDETSAPACGSEYGRTVYNGANVFTKWSDDEKHELEAVAVTLPSGTPKDSLGAEIRNRLGRAVQPCESASSSCFEHPSGISVFISDQVEPPELWIAISDCLD